MCVIAESIREACLLSNSDSTVVLNSSTFPEYITAELEGPQALAAGAFVDMVVQCQLVGTGVENFGRMAAALAQLPQAAAKQDTRQLEIPSDAIVAKEVFLTAMQQQGLPFDLAVNWLQVSFLPGRVCVSDD